MMGWLGGGVCKVLCVSNSTAFKYCLGCVDVWVLTMSDADIEPNPV